MTARANVLARDTPYCRTVAPAAARAVSARTVDAFTVALDSDLSSLEPVWRAFQETADCTVFQTFEWLSAWQHHIGARAGVVPHIVTVRDANGTLLSILPLASAQRGPLRELVWLGSELCDYNAPLVAAGFAQQLDAATFAALWRRIVQAVQMRARCDIVRLEKMPATIGAQPNPMLALPTVLNPSGCYATKLGASWDKFYEAKRSAATRARDRSKRKRLAAHGQIQFATAADASEALSTLQVLIEQKSAAFARRGIGNIFSRAGYTEFYRDLATDPQTRSLVHISALRVGDTVAATNFALTFKERYYYVLSSYTDGEMARLGPGAAHLHELFRYAIERGFGVFDFTIGDEPYKRDWCDRAEPLYDMVAVISWRGLAAATPLLAFSRLKRAIKQNPRLWSLFSKARALVVSRKRPRGRV